MRIWSLRDERVGSSKQAEALARGLDAAAVVKNVVYGPLIALPNIIRPCGVGVNFSKSDDLLSAGDPPDVVVFAGRRLAGVAIFLKRHFWLKFARRVRLIAILNPNWGFRNFDLVILPLHDRHGFSGNRSNVVYINGSLCDSRIPPIDQLRAHWGEKLEARRPPFFSLLVGGDTRQCKINPTKLGSMVRKVSSYVAGRGGTLLVSSSRRTGAACLGEVKKSLDCDSLIYEWQDGGDRPNPYYLFIEKSAMVFITGDSIAMISEVATLGKPIYVLYLAEEFAGLKQERFCRNLVDLGVIRIIGPDSGSLEEFSNNRPLNELERVLELVRDNILGHATAL
ncbi:MAG: mitochondrial fission ELM1 family protein [Rickettsiales bacterium]|nr:mitochondrial fission ELM1 family protein [Rickettsiales bacterium]